MKIRVASPESVHIHLNLKQLNILSSNWEWNCVLTRNEIHAADIVKHC